MAGMAGIGRAADLVSYTVCYRGMWCAVERNAASARYSMCSVSARGGSIA